MANDLLNEPTYDGYNRIFQRGKHDYHPVPQREIELSKGVIKQYTAY
jgi:hypothetical protein